MVFSNSNIIILLCIFLIVNGCNRTIPKIIVEKQNPNKLIKDKQAMALIVCPTRELAAQVAENVEQYGKYLKLEMALLIGGVSFAEQDKKLMRGVDILIATPGRLLDQFDRGKILMTGVQTLVVDEADRMLDMGFIPDIERIFQLTPFTRQVLFFSATMPNEIKRLVDQFLHQPLTIQIARKNMMPMQAGDVPSTWADTALLRSLTGFQPKTNISDGIHEFVNWYIKYYGIDINSK